MTTSPDSLRKRYVVDNPEGLDLAFDGRLLLSERHHDTGRVDIYETASGRFVLRQRRSSRPGIVVVDRMEVGDDLETMLSHLSPSPGRSNIMRSLELNSEIEI